MNPRQNSESKPSLTIGRGSVLAAVVIILAFYLIREHAAHVLAGVPYVFLLLCPLMHLLMHRRGHGGPHNGSRGGRPSQVRDKE